MLDIGKVKVGPGQPCRVVAELSNNHNGSLALALDLIEAAKDAGADFVKFQAYTPQELIALRGDAAVPPAWRDKYPTMADLYGKAQTPFKWFPDLIAKCEDVGILWFSSAFGPGSLAIIQAFGSPVVKLAALDYERRAFVKAARATGLPLLRSCPNIKAPKGDASLWCPPGYPQPLFRGMREAMRSHLGFSYHGTDPLVPFMAATLGAKLVEVHFQATVPSELEANISLGPDQLDWLVTSIRNMEACLR